MDKMVLTNPLVAAKIFNPKEPTGSTDILIQSIIMTDLIFGLYAVELWHYNDASGMLTNVNLGTQDEETGRKGGGGLLLKRRTQEADPDSIYVSSEAVDAFNDLTDQSRKDYIPVLPTSPGVGLPGVLWAESSHAVVGGANNTKHLGYMSMTNLVGGGGQDTVRWRNVKDLADDPDQVSSVYSTL